MVIVTLSRRNLLTLLAKLDIAHSQRTISMEGSVTLVVRAELDEHHYSIRPPPGEMHPETEERLELLAKDDAPPWLHEDYRPLTPPEEME